MKEGEEQTEQCASRHFASELDLGQQAGKHGVGEAHAEDTTSNQQNLTLMQSVGDESSVDPSLMSNHSAYINVSHSDDENQWPMAHKGVCCHSALLSNVARCRSNPLEYV